MEKYLTYLTEDFAADESFQRWVFKESKDADIFWENFLAKYPEKQAQIEEATALLRSLLPNKNAEKYAQETQEAIARLQTSLRKQKQPILTITRNTEKRKVFALSTQARRIAAGLLVLFTLSTLAYFLISNYLGNTTYQTAYGETQNLTLPDGSKVTLNSNSTLTFAKNWEQGKNREVWLNGEAFFEVEKQANAEKKGLVKFTVHSANVDVEVVGTQFNVWNRQNQVAVVLNEGKVKLNIKVENKPTQTVEMLPNEIVEVLADKQTFTKKKVKTELYTSWKAQEFVFENTPLAEVASKIEEVYGLKVKFQDKKMAKETLTGVIPCKNEALFFEVLSTALDIKIEKRDKEVIFSRKR
jgi:ferric-dicitrate binding protein FerR (iron transport regulator)